jgi:hypothetical protein
MSLLLCVVDVVAIAAGVSATSLMPAIVADVGCYC